MGFGPSSAFLMRYFASHGWLVGAPDHKGNTIADNIEPRPLAIYHLRSQDISAALDAIGSSNDFEATANTKRVLLSGHSFGVHTCWASLGATFDMEAVSQQCADSDCPQADLDIIQGGFGDPRIVAAILMAGSIDRALFGENGHSSVTAPLLSMSGTLDPVGADSQFDSTASVDLTWIDIDGGCHQSFALGICDTLDADSGFAVINTYAMAFGRAHILSDSSEKTLGILDGSVQVSPLVSFQRRTP
jgi:predicted dienelactone hydrolase